VRSLIVYLNPITLLAWRRFYRELLAPDDVVIDVSAHVGTRVRVVTLDSVIASFGTPRYIKIDTEGFEEQVLAGLSTPIELISVEFIPGFRHLSRYVVRRLMSLGNYRFNPVVGETGTFASSQWRASSATSTWLDALDASSASGDLFARLDDGEATETTF